MGAVSTILMLLVIIYFLIIPSLKTGTFSVFKLAITPAVFMYLNYRSVQTQFYLHAGSYLILLSGLIIGALVGAFFRKNTAIRADREKSLIEVPGSYFGLIVFIVIFAVHFVIGYIESVSPEYLLQAGLGEQLLMFLLTLTSCIPIGSNALLFYKYHKVNSVSLTEE